MDEKQATGLASNELLCCPFCGRFATREQWQRRAFVASPQYAPDPFKKGLFRAIEILRAVRLSDGNEEREAWPAIREAIKGIEAEI